jgi:transposase-like protein
MSVLSRTHFYDEKAAFEHVESILWPEGPVCPHCGNCDKHYKLEGVRSKPSKKNPEGVERHGLYKCAACRLQFTVRIGTIFEESKLPLHKWLQAIHLMCSSKKGISSNQLARVLEITVKSAWFLSHRIRHAMDYDRSNDPIGGNGKTVEIDETYIGRLKGTEVRKGGSLHKNAVLTLVERNGIARSFHVDNTSAKDVLPIILKSIKPDTMINTDEAGQYRNLKDHFAGHESVHHGKKEYARGAVTTNTVEGYYSIFKRGMKGIYQHCAEHHLHRYLAEFDFRYSNRIKLGCDDNERSIRALEGVKGKRLTYYN